MWDDFLVVIPSWILNLSQVPLLFGVDWTLGYHLKSIASLLSRCVHRVLIVHRVFLSDLVKFVKIGPPLLGRPISEKALPYYSYSQ